MLNQQRPWRLVSLIIICLLVFGLPARGDSPIPAQAAADYYDMAQTDAGVYYLAADHLNAAHLWCVNAQGEASDLGPIPYETVNPDGDAPVVSCLTGSGATLYGFSRDTGEFFTINPQAQGLDYERVTTFDVTCLPQDEDAYSIQSACMMDGVFYFSCYRYDGETYAGELYAFDLATGKGRLLPVGSVQCAIPYKTGQLLLFTVPLYQDAEAHIYVPEQPELTVYDIAAQTFASLSPVDGWNLGGLAYDPHNDLIYYLDSGALFCQGAQGEAQQIAYTPLYGGFWNGQGFVMNNAYYNYDLSGAYSRSVTGSHLPQATLAVYGSWGAWQEGEIAFARQHEDVRLAFVEETFADIPAALQASESTVDVVHLEASQLNALMEAGLLAEMDDLPFAAEWVAALPEEIRQAVTKDGRLYGLPLSLSAWCTAYNAQVLEAMGLTPAQLPRSYQELFLFLTRWNREWADQPYRPLSPWGLRSSLFYDLMQAWADRYEQREESLTFDTPLFLTMMEDWMAMDLTRLEISRLDDLTAEALAMPCLFTSCTLEEALTNPQLVLWPLAVAPGEEAAIGSSLYCAAIPAASSHKDEAASLLNCYLDALTPAQRAVLAPLEANPAANPLYDQQINQWENDLARLDAQQAEGALDVSASLQICRWQLEHREAYRHLPSAQQLETLRERIAPLLFLRRDQPLAASLEDTMGFAALEERFLEGSLSPSQFAREMERKVQMARMMQP